MADTVNVSVMFSILCDFVSFVSLVEIIPLSRAANRFELRCQSKANDAIVLQI